MKYFGQVQFMYFSGEIGGTNREIFSRMITGNANQKEGNSRNSYVKGLSLQYTIVQ